MRNFIISYIWNGNISIKFINFLKSVPNYLERNPFRQFYFLLLRYKFTIRINYIYLFCEKYFISMKKLLSWHTVLYRSVFDKKKYMIYMNASRRLKMKLIAKKRENGYVCERLIGVSIFLRCLDISYSR